MRAYKIKYDCSDSDVKYPEGYVEHDTQDIQTDDNMPIADYAIHTVGGWWNVCWIDNSQEAFEKYNGGQWEEV